MTKPTITLAMIVKDEEENLPQCLDSVAKHVDEIVIVDTGSSDKTKEVAARYGAKIFDFNAQTNPESFFVDDEATCKSFGAPGPYSGQVALGDFGAARAESFRHATKDFILWIDADDILEGAEHLHDVAADMQSRNLNFGFFRYEYARDAQGRVFYSQWRERLIRRDSAVWANVVHEVLLPKTPIVSVKYDKVYNVHRRKADRKGIDHRNYKLLLRLLKKHHDEKTTPDPRTLFYLGQEARFIEPEKAIGFYTEYLKKSGWPEERAAAHVALGMIFEFGMIQGAPKEELLAQADREYAAAAVEMPDNPDGLLGLARVAYLRERFNDCIGYTERAFKIGNTDSMLGMNPMDRLYRPHVYLNHALACVGRLEEAIKSCKDGLAVCPDDPGVPGGAPGMLKFNLDLYEKELARLKSGADPNAAIDGKTPRVVLGRNEDLKSPPADIPPGAQIIWAVQLWKQCMTTGDFVRAATLIGALPPALHADPLCSEMLAITNTRLRQRESKDAVDIVLFLGPGPEAWDPSTPNGKGLGGSETAAIEMAKHFAKRGNKVHVYAEADCVVDGVEYRHHSVFQGAKCDVFIASRVPWAICELGKVEAQTKILWVHDIHCGPNSPQMESWLMQFDKIFCLSNWHKDFFCQTYPCVHADTVVVTRNGIDATRFPSELPVKENRIVFSSSPNRGLLTLLEAMPKIREQVPDAVVDAFYGLDTWEQIAKRSNAHAELAQIEQYKKEIARAEKEGFLVWHGKRPQTEVTQAYLRAKVWGYPTLFPETYCITALEAQAAGAVPVASKFAALEETAKRGVLIDPRQPDALNTFVATVVRLLKDDVYRGSFIPGMREFALGQTWESLADEWLALFNTFSKDVPRWRAA